MKSNLPKVRTIPHYMCNQISDGGYHELNCMKNLPSSELHSSEWIHVNITLRRFVKCTTCDVSSGNLS